MTISHLLQDFGTSLPEEKSYEFLSETALEEKNLENFEKGYAAGWDDALSSQVAERNQISETMARNLEDVSFTFNEAYQQVLSSVTPMVSAFVDKVLPEVMGGSLDAIAAEQARILVGDADDYAVELRVPPGASGRIRPLVERSLGRSIVVTELHDLNEGQVSVHVGARERIFDAGRLISSLRGSVEAFAHESELEARYG